MFRLSDVYNNMDRWKANEQSMMLNQQKFDDHNRKQNQEQMLADIFANSMVEKGGSPAVPEQVMPEGVLGPPAQGQPAVPGQRQLDLRMATEQAARAGLSGSAWEIDK